MPVRPTISWRDFGKLRLLPFVPAADVRKLRDWSYMEKLWVGEAVGFTEWLRRKEDSKVLRSMALDLVALETRTAGTVLERIQLPVRGGMTRARIERLLGEPTRTQRFPTAKDRVTLIYETLTSPESYRISCTVKAAGGLNYLVVQRGDWDAPLGGRSRAGAGK